MPEPPEQPDTDTDLEEADSSDAALEVHPEDVPTSSNPREDATDEDPA